MFTAKGTRDLGEVIEKFYILFVVLVIQPVCVFQHS